MPDSICQWPGCTIEMSASRRPRKWCDTHRKAKAVAYQQERRVTMTTPCQVQDCDRPLRRRGLCGMHYRRWERSNGLANPPSDRWTEQRKANKKKRLAIRRGADADTAEIIYAASIYNRDSWTCQICQQPVDRNLKWPHLMSASIDHRLPLVAGGTHTRDNVQLAHVSCNARKGLRLPERLADSA